MSVLDRSALVDSPLADLHAIASELTIDGYRRLRRDELIDAILDKQGGGAASASASDADGEAEAPKPRRSRSRARSKATTEETEADKTGADVKASKADDDVSADAADAADDAEPAKPSRSRRGRGRKPAEAETESPAARASEDDDVVEGTVEVLPGGSGFVRVAGTEPSDDDVYISSAQVKRCELVTGDTVSGPKRAPRRSERFASLIRVETINGRPASEQADSVHFDDLPAALPAELVELGADDPTLKAIQALAPFGRGSRVTITGPSRAGKTEALRRIAAVLAGQDGLTVSLALAGVRPEEISEWSAEEAAVAPAAAVSFAASADARAAALDPVVDQARRLAARGTHAVVLVDTLDGLDPLVARKLMASARNLTGGGSVTIVATATEPVGGETTVIALDAVKAGTARFPAIDVLASGTLRPELLVGETAAKKIVRERVKAAKD